MGIFSLNRFVAYAILILTAPMVFASDAPGHPCELRLKDNGNSTEYCEHYVLGFLEGALLTQAGTIVGPEPERSRYMERVVKARAVRLGKFSPSANDAKICLPAPVKTSEIARAVSESLQNSGSIVSQEGERIYAILQDLYPCA